MQPFSQACENNKQPILTVLARIFKDSRHVLEIGSGTGQHAVFFARELAHLTWQTSDVLANHQGIHRWLSAYPAPNLLTPVEFDLRAPIWPESAIDAVFSANTAHIVSWPLVEVMLTAIAEHLPVGGHFVLYGPFNYAGQFTSDSNRAFDQFLRERDPASGIRDIEALQTQAARVGLELQDDVAMPANNRCLVWRKNSSINGD